MNLNVRVGIIGDYDPKKYVSHVSTNEALGHAASALSVSISFTWIATSSLSRQPVGTTLKKFDALWCAPGSPYESMDGALQAIRFAREMGWPFLSA